MARAAIPALLLLAALSACSSLVPHRTLHLVASLDPFAPNWEVEATPLPDNRYHLSLKMKRYGDGGAGEASELFNRRARSLAQAGGFEDYQVLDYSEGMDSSVIGAQRVAQGDIRLIGKAGPPQGSAPPARSTPASAAKPLS